MVRLHAASGGAGRRSRKDAHDAGRTQDRPLLPGDHAIIGTFALDGPENAQWTSGCPL